LLIALDRDQQAIALATAAHRLVIAIERDEQAIAGDDNGRRATA
jgi:hypothetical protein